MSSAVSQRLSSSSTVVVVVVVVVAVVVGVLVDVVGWVEVAVLSRAVDGAEGGGMDGVGLEEREEEAVEEDDAEGAAGAGVVSLEDGMEGAAVAGAAEGGREAD